MGDANPERPDPAERLAALASLMALTAALVIVAVAAAANWQGIVLTLLGLLLIVVAGWYVVSRRGIARTVAVLTGLAGAGLLIAGFIVADLSLLAWVSVAVLALLSVATARLALHQSSKAMRERAGSRSPVPPARHPVLIMNPKSGGGRWRGSMWSRSATGGGSNRSFSGEATTSCSWPKRRSPEVRT